MSNLDRSTFTTFGLTFIVQNLTEMINRSVRVMDFVVFIERLNSGVRCVYNLLFLEFRQDFKNRLIYREFQLYFTTDFWPNLSD